MVRGIPAYLLGIHLEQRKTDRYEQRVRDRTWVYVIHWQDRGPTKVGVAGDPRLRRSELQGGNPYPLKIFTAFGLAEIDMAFEIEGATLERLKACRLMGEWLDATPIQVRDAVQECITKRGYRPLNWETPPPKRNNARARRAMDEYKRLQGL